MCMYLMEYDMNGIDDDQTPFMGDDKVSVADAHAYGTLKVMKSKKSDILNGFPHLMKWEETMNGLDGVKMYNERV